MIIAWGFFSYILWFDLNSQLEPGTPTCNVKGSGYLVS